MDHSGRICSCLDPLGAYAASLKIWPRMRHCSRSSGIFILGMICQTTQLFLQYGFGKYLDPGYARS